MQIETTLVKRRKLSLTPLIDVIFLLLLFFMLSSTFSRYAEVEISHGNGSASSTKPAVAFLELGANTLKLNNVEIAKDDLTKLLLEVKENGKEALVLVVSGDVASQQFISVLQIANSGPLPVSVARRSK
ncbi:MAG: biopolymer transporter ExbD [Pseudomonadota bacterium]